MSETQARVKWIEGTLSLAMAGKHSVLIDRAVNLGGAEAGFKASELLLLSLGGCLSSTLVGATKARNLTLAKADVQLVGKTIPNPDRFGEIEVVVDLAVMNNEGVELPDTELDKLVDLAERGCFITNTLRNAVQISVRRAGGSV